MTMLAPRKKLWSTPAAVADAAVSLLAVTPDDVIADFGCGDGVALIAAAQRVRCRAVGWEIDAPRAAQASAHIAELGLSDHVTIHAGNALEARPCGVTVVFLYLIERGLRMLLPLLARIASDLPGPLRILTVLYRLPAPLVPTEVHHVQLGPLVRFPLYLYRLSPAELEAAVTPAALPSETQRGLVDGAAAAGAASSGVTAGADVSPEEAGASEDASGQVAAVHSGKG